MATDVLNAIPSDGPAAVPDSVIERLVIAGTIDECRQRLDTYRQAGIDLPILSAVSDPGIVLSTFAEQC